MTFVNTSIVLCDGADLVLFRTIRCNEGRCIMTAESDISWSADKKLHGWTLPQAAWPLKLWGVRHIRWMWLTNQVYQAADRWAARHSTHHRQVLADHLEWHPHRALAALAATALASNPTITLGFKLGDRARVCHPRIKACPDRLRKSPYRLGSNQRRATAGRGC